MDADLRQEATVDALALLNELRDAYNRHVAGREVPRVCPHGEPPAECGDPDCSVVWIMES